MIRVICGDAGEELKKMGDESVQCCVTSPPYWGLRDYGVSGQLGLEKTPEEYIAKMVAVFREVRRVLRGDGTCWVNMGDSYNSPNTHTGKADKVDWGIQRVLDAKANAWIGNKNLKPKDLMGIPWRLAFALQQPYYTGTIKDERDRIWLAAMIDAEGCMFIHKRNAGSDSGAKFTRKDGSEAKYIRTQDTYGAGLEVANCHESIVRRCLEITGMGSVCSQGPYQNKRRKQKIFRWNLRTSVCREIIREIYPHLVGKKHEARILLGCPTSGPEAEKAHAALKALHNGYDVGIDYPEPKSMFEPGWYLRQEIIWSKANPMPESVRDRCTKAHEQVFLLSKSARYYFDQEAIKERVSGTAHKRQPVNGKPASMAFKMEPAGKGNRNNSSFQSYMQDLNPELGRNRRSVWTIPTEPYPGSHFATFPTALVQPCILAGTSARGCCPKCGAPWERVVESGPNTGINGKHDNSIVTLRNDALRHSGRVGETPKATTGWRPTCKCGETATIPCTVLDPFGGSGTVGQVALELGRSAILIELNPKYIELINQRTLVTPGLGL